MLFMGLVGDFMGHRRALLVTKGLVVLGSFMFGIPAEAEPAALIFMEEIEQKAMSTISPKYFCFHLPMPISIYDLLLLYHLLETYDT